MGGLLFRFLQLLIMQGPILPGENLEQIRRYPQLPTFATLPKCHVLISTSPTNSWGLNHKKSAMILLN